MPERSFPNPLPRIIPVPSAPPCGVRRLRNGVTWAGMLVLAIGSSGCRPPAMSEAPDETVSVSLAVDRPTTAADAKALRESLAEFNHGAGFMERYQYSDAAAAFTKVLERQPDWTAAQFNLALAQLNMLGQSEAKDNLESARLGFEAILAGDPQHLHARFCLGMYYQHIGDLDKTLECFQAVYEGDPDDSYVGYKYAEALRNAGRPEEALPILETVVERNPGFISAVYLLATSYTRASMRDKAMPLFERFKRLNSAELTGGSFVVQATYGMAGKYYRVLGPDDLPLTIPPGPEQPRIVFSPQTRTWEVATHGWKWPGGTIGLPGLAVADVDGDGHLDVCLAGCDERGTAVLWRNEGEGKFSAGQTLAEGVVSICFGDVDNDGHVDLWLGRAGPDLLLMNDGQGHFAAADDAVLAGPDALTHIARLLDVDSDGDLDFLAFRLEQGDLPVPAGARPAAWNLFGTNGDGTFADLSGEGGFDFPDQAIAAVVYDDFENSLRSAQLAGKRPRGLPPRLPRPARCGTCWRSGRPTGRPAGRPGSRGSSVASPTRAAHRPSQAAGIRGKPRARLRTPTPSPLGLRTSPPPATRTARRRRRTGGPGCWSLETALAGPRRLLAYSIPPL